MEPTKEHIYNNDSPSQEQKIQYKNPNNQRKRVASDYGQDINWTKSPEDKQRHHIPAQAKPSRGIPKLTSSDFKPVGCIGIAAPRGSVLVEVLASNTHKI